MDPTALSHRDLAQALGEFSDALDTAAPCTIHESRPALLHEAAARIIRLEAELTHALGQLAGATHPNGGQSP